MVSGGGDGGWRDGGMAGWGHGACNRIKATAVIAQTRPLYGMYWHAQCLLFVIFTVHMTITPPAADAVAGQGKVVAGCRRPGWEQRPDQSRALAKE